MHDSDNDPPAPAPAPTNPAARWRAVALLSIGLSVGLVVGIGLTVGFAEGEEMRTEVSAKFRRAGVAGELAAAGFEMRSWWTDAAAQFGRVRSRTRSWYTSSPSKSTE